MNSDSRVIGAPVALDYEKVRGFFTRRSARIPELGPLQVTMYQEEELARQRDMHEKRTLLPVLAVNRHSRILDIGCGVGRWADDLAPLAAAYLGTDFCEAYVSVTRQKLAAAGLPPTTHSCQQIAAQDISAPALAVAPPFDLVVIAGLLMYLNDDDVRRVLSTIPALTDRRAVIYVREPVGVRCRLTLRSDFSIELGDYYNAVYRSVPEYESLFHECLGAFETALAKPLFSGDLCNRQETAQHVFVLKLQPH
jgi:SAM-dependent methyltransferase